MFYPGKREPPRSSSNPKVRGSCNAQPGLWARYESNVYSFSHDSEVNIQNPPFQNPEFPS